MRSRSLPRRLVRDPGEARYSLVTELYQLMERQLLQWNLWSPRLQEHYRQARALLAQANDYWAAVSDRIPEEPSDTGELLAHELRHFCSPGGRPLAVRRYLDLHKKRMRANRTRFAYLLRERPWHVNDDDVDALARAATQLLQELQHLIWYNMAPTQQLFTLLERPYTIRVGSTPEGMTVVSATNRRQRLRLKAVGPHLVTIEPY